MRGTQFFTHFILLCIIFLLPDFFMSMERPTPLFWATKPLFFILMFYINFYYFIDRFFFNKKKRWIFRHSGNLVGISVNHGQTK